MPHPDHSRYISAATGSACVFRNGYNSRKERSAMLDAIEDGTVKVGMTHEMVAWAIGFPAFEGSPSELYGLSDWDYDSR